MYHYAINSQNYIQKSDNKYFFQNTNFTSKLPYFNLFKKKRFFFKCVIKTVYISIDAEINKQINNKTKESKKSLFSKFFHKQTK